MKNIGANNFVTSDFYTAAFLKAVEVPLIGINKSNPKRFRFVFEDNPKRIKLIDDFFTGRAVVEPRQLIAAIKELKSLMYSDALVGSEYGQDME